METHADYQATPPTGVAQNVPADALELIRKYRPEIAHDIERISSLRRSHQIPDETPQDKLADDYTWLWDFEYQGEKLSAKEIEFIIIYAKQGFDKLTGALAKAGIASTTDPWAKPRVCAALHEATKNMAKSWQINTAKVGRQIFNIIQSNISDVADIGPAGIVLKDFSQLPKHITDAVQEVHEVRNAQGTQIRVKFYDKLAAANIMLRVMNAFPKETLQVEFSGLDEKLASAIQRLKSEPKDIEGEVVIEQG
jgi:hypothetical protein